jgi:CBS domain-containing protein
VTVADVMDPDPVTLDGATTVLEAQERVFEPNNWPFVAVVDDEQRFLGVLERETAAAELEAGRPALAVRDALRSDRAEWSIRPEQQLEDLLSAPALRGPGAVFAVDADDFLRGVVTLDQVRRAISPAPGR